MFVDVATQVAERIHVVKWLPAKVTKNGIKIFYEINIYLSPPTLRLSEDHIPLIMSQAKARAKPKLATNFQVSVVVVCVEGTDGEGGEGERL